MTSKTATSQFSVKRRIRQLYDRINQRDFKRCFQMIDPQIRQVPTSITFYQYESAVAQYLEIHGSITITEVDVKLHIDEPSTLYQDRDFALGKTTWLNEAGEVQYFLERWVREGRAWYTRSTGFVAAAPLKKKIPIIHSPKRKLIPAKVNDA